MKGPHQLSYEERRHACIALRRRLAVSQSTLAAAAGITRERLNRFENSKIALTEFELARMENILARLRARRVAELETAC